MNKCRICLRSPKTLMGIFESGERTAYSDMIVSFANVKIEKDDGLSDKICRSCRKTLQEAYNFKLLIERSDAELNGNSNLKKIKFNNINDVKVEIEIEIDDKKNIKKLEDTTAFLRQGVNEFCYYNTIVKKIESTKNDDVCLKPIPVLEFLKTINDDPDNGNFNEDLQDYDADDYGGASDNDVDYVPPDMRFDIPLSQRKCTRQQRSKKFKVDYETNSVDDGDYIPPYKLLNLGKNKRKYKKRTLTSKKENTKPRTQKEITEVCIKPVYLSNLKLIYSKPVHKEKEKKKYDRLLVCPHCGILTKTLKNHILRHTGDRNYKCDECEKAFYAESSLKSHKKIGHAKTKDFKCDQCTAAFSSKQSWQSHKTVHNPVLNHVCDICSKAFKRIAALRRHSKGHNSANKTVMCDLCNMSFFSKYGLRHHLRIHTGERPYNCEICKQPYSYKHDFNRHCLNKHGVCFKRRSVFVLNEEVLKQERILMRDLMLRVHGVIKDDKPLNPFEGPQAAMAFEHTIKALEAKQIPVDFQL